MVDPYYIRIDLSGLRVLQSAAGAPLRVQVSITNRDQYAYQELEPQSGVITGLVTDQSGIVRFMLSSITVWTWATPIPGVQFGLGLGQTKVAAMSTSTALPSSAAGQSLRVYVGDQRQFSSYAVGDQFFAPSQVLSLDVTVSGVSVTPPTGGTGGTGGTTPPSGTSGTPKLSTMEIAALGVGGLLLLPFLFPGGGGQPQQRTKAQR